MAAGPAPAVLPLVETYEAFFRHEYGGLVALAYGLSGSLPAAEDLAQEALLVTYRRWDEVARLDLPSAWVRRVCANLATSWLRRRAAEMRALVRTGPAGGGAAGPDEAFWAEVRRLPRRQAQCIALRYVYGCPVTEVADVLGCSEGSVKQHLARARDRLAPRLTEGAT